jgi:hypothetical protein
MIYAKVKNSTLIQYPYGFSELQQDNPYTNFGSNTDVAYWFPQTETALVSGNVLVEVQLETPPSINPDTETCIQQDTPALVDNTWVLEWTVVPLTEEQKLEREAAAKLANKQRAEKLLTDTDWTQVADVPLLNKQAFIDYRAAVRAVALNPTVDATFPTLPVEQWS